MVFSDLVRLGGLFALEAGPVAVVCFPGAERRWHHRHTAGGTNRRPLVVRWEAGVAQRLFRASWLLMRRTLRGALRRVRHPAGRRRTRTGVVCAQAVDAHARIRATEDESGRPPHPAVRRAGEGVRGVEVRAHDTRPTPTRCSPARNGRPLAHRNATGRGFDKAAANAGIESVTFHSIRHAFARRMISRGINSTVLAALMGHESSTITERRYIHLFDRQRTDEQVRQAMGFASGSSHRG